MNTVKCLELTITTVHLVYDLLNSCINVENLALLKSETLKVFPEVGPNVQSIND